MGEGLRAAVASAREACNLLLRGGGFWAPRVLFPDSPAADPVSAGTLEEGMKERARLEGGSAVAPAHWKVQCWRWIRRLGNEAGAGGGMIRDVNGMGMSEQGAAASQLQAAAAAPDARVWSWSHCWKSKRRRGAGLPGGPGARTSAAPWSWETSPTRSTFFSPVTLESAKDLTDLAVWSILAIYEIVSTAEVR